MSGTEMHTKASGLFTDPSPMLAPDGALREAQNVDIDRDGLITPRPGINTILSSAPVSKLVRSIFAYQGHLLCASAATGGYSSLSWHWDGAGSALSSMSDPPTGRRPKACTARKNLYVTGNGGVRKLTGTSDTTAEAAGRAWLTGLADLVSTGTPRALATGKSVAYRWCYVRTDPNGYITRSAPSPYMRVDNASGATRDIQLTILLPPELVVGDVVEIYRSTAVDTSSTPADTEYLARTYVLVSGDISNVYCTPLDTALDEELGAELYTNATQEGIDQANELPPLAKDIATFGQYTFYANTVSRHRLLLNMLSWDRGYASGRQFGLRAPFSIGGGISYTSGSPSVTMTSTTGLTAGMTFVISGSEPTDAGPFPAGTVISTVVNATTVTMSANATATDSKAAKAVDIVTIGSTQFFGWTSTIVLKRSFLADNTTGSGLRTTAANLAACVNSWPAVGVRASPVYTDPTQTIVQMLFEEIAIGGNAFTVSSSAMWDPDIRTAKSSTTDTWPHALWWSKTNQPEAVPLLNYTLIGSETAEILRIYATRNALYIFKRDGVWRLNGDTPDTFRIDSFDKSLRLIHEEGLCEHRGNLFAWTERGLVAINDSGSVAVTDQRIAFEIKAGQDLCATYPSTVAAQPCVWLVSHPVEDRLFLGYSAAAAEHADKIYVFHPNTSAWTRWAVTAACMAYDVDSNALYFGSPSSAYDVLKERPITDTIRNADSQQSGTISTVTGSNVTITGLSTTPAVGDLVYQAGGRGVVSTVVTTSPLVLTLDSVTGMSTGACTVYTSFSSVVEWVAKTAEQPGRRKLWREGALSFDSLTGVYSLAVAFSSDISASSSSKSATRTRETSDKAKDVRFYVPRAHGRCVFLYPKLTIAQAGAAWRLSALDLVVEPMSERVGRAA